MNEVKTFEELKEELGNDYDKKLYEMGVSALNEITRLNNIINEFEEFLQSELADGRSKTHLWLMGCYDEDKKILDKLKELKKGNK